MVWIPITVLFCVCWYIRAFVGQVKQTKFQIEYDMAEAKRKKLETVVLDTDMERELERALRKEYFEWGKIVSEFMGGGDEWADYADFNRGFLKAETVLMLREGKLPSAFVYPLGTDLDLWYKSPTAMKGHNISRKRSLEMNEEFVFKIEKTLADHGIESVPLCLPNNGVGESWVPLHEYINKNGSGSTKQMTHFRFVSK